MSEHSREMSVVPGKITVVVPTYDERENLEDIVRRVLELGDSYHVLVVDDNSPDGTGDLADELVERGWRVSVLHRAGKLGLGTAYIEGFTQALAEGAEFIAQMDADGSHHPRYLAEMVAAAQDADLVVGSRYRKHVNCVDWAFRRVLLSKLANIYVNRVTGLPFRDATAGFSVWRREALEAVELDTIRSRGYAFQIEMKHRAWRAGLQLCEHSIIFFGREAGHSKLDKSTAREALYLVLRLGFGRVGRGMWRVLRFPFRRAEDPGLPAPRFTVSELTPHQFLWEVGAGRADVQR